MSTVSEAVPGRARLGASIAALAAFAVSFSNIVTPAVYAAGGSVLALLLLRYAGFVLVCVAVLRARGVRLRLPRARAFECFGIGAFFLLGGGGLTASFAYLPVSLAILVFYVFPLLTLLFECVLDRHLPRRAQALLMLAAFGGVALSLSISSVAIDPLGFALALVGATGVAVAFTWCNRRMVDVDRVVLTTHMSIAAVAFCCIAALLGVPLTLVAPTAPAWTAFTLACVLFCVGFFAMFVAVGRIGATRTSMVMNLEVVFTVLLALVLLGEAFTPLQGLGAAVVVGAVTWMQRAPSGVRPRAAGESP